MGLLVNPAKVAQLYGAPLAIADVSGTVDGTSHMTMVVGDTVVTNDIPYGETRNGIVGNFVAKIGDREIDGRLVKGIQTIGWITEQGRMLSLGSPYKKNSDGARNPKNVDVPEATSKADAIKALMGRRITVLAIDPCQVNAFRPAPGEDKTVESTWVAFKVSKKKVASVATATEEEDED